MAKTLKNATAKEVTKVEKPKVDKPKVEKPKILNFQNGVLKFVDYSNSFNGDNSNG